VTQPDGSTFDEQAALAELERLQAAIQAARRQRLQVNDEFDTFVRTMRQQPPADVAQTRSVRSSDRPRIVPGPIASSAPEGASMPAPAVAAAAMTWSSPAETERPRDAHAASPPSRLLGRLRPRQIAVVAVALAVFAIIVLLSRSPGREPASGTPPSQSAGTGSTPAPPTAAPAPAESPAPVQIELTTIRPAWMRVIVDGERIVEREVPAGQQLRYSANREITVRAGDAGAVRLRVAGGEPAPLGRDGFPVTRTFRPAAAR
jgi:hypothetical protein